MRYPGPPTLVGCASNPDVVSFSHEPVRPNAGLAALERKSRMKQVVGEDPITVKVEEGSHEFTGDHLVANYFGCAHDALIRVADLIETMKRAVKVSGATLLKTAQYVFPGYGMTAAMLLSESHASIHTYPEHDACFIDLFTCGHACSAKKFDEVMRQYLCPVRVSYKLLRRHQHIEEDIFIKTDSADLKPSGLFAKWPPKSIKAGNYANPKNSS